MGTSSGTFGVCCCSIAFSTIWRVCQWPSQTPPLSPAAFTLFFSGSLLRRSTCLPGQVDCANKASCRFFAFDFLFSALCHFPFAVRTESTFKMAPSRPSKPKPKLSIKSREAATPAPPPRPAEGMPYSSVLKGSSGSARSYPSLSRPLSQFAPSVKSDH